MNGNNSNSTCVEIPPAALEPIAAHDGERLMDPRIDVDVCAYTGKSKKGEARGKDCNAPVLAVRAVKYRAGAGASHPAFFSSRGGVEGHASLRASIAEPARAKARDGVGGRSFGDLTAKAGIKPGPRDSFQRRDTSFGRAVGAASTHAIHQGKIARRCPDLSHLIARAA